MNRHDITLVSKLQRSSARYGMMFDGIRFGMDPDYAADVFNQLCKLNDVEIHGWAIVLFRSLYGEERLQSELARAGRQAK